MDFSKLKNRIIFLKPLKINKNSMGENVPIWIPFKPTINHNLQTEDDKIHLTQDNSGNAILVYADGKSYAHTLALAEFAVWANVTPMTGHEYVESQKIRAETTYRITTRFFQNITTDMKVLYNGKTFDIVSVLNIEERNIELQIICSEVDTNGKG